MDYQDVYVLAGLYASPDDAQLDFDRLSALHKDGVVGKYQAALFEKQPDGKVKVLDTTSTTRATGAKWGTAIGAAIGLIFPPSIIVGAAGGAALGALTGNLSKGWYRGDVKRLAEQLEPGQAGVVAVAEAGPTVEEAQILAGAQRTQNEHVTGEDAEKMRQQLEHEQPVATG